MPYNFCMWFDFFSVHFVFVASFSKEHSILRLFFWSLYDFVGFTLTIIFMYIDLCLFELHDKAENHYVFCIECEHWYLSFVNWIQFSIGTMLLDLATVSIYNSFYYYYLVHSPLFYVFYFQQTAMYCCSIVNSLIPQSNQMQADQTLVANIF